MKRQPQPVIIAVIPARGGSQRLPGKNVKRMCGRPLVAWPVRAALAVRVFAAVLVSTECPAIARAARRAGAQVVRRPARLATARAAVYGAVCHAVRAWEKRTGRRVDIIVLLQPTTPTTTGADIRACLRHIVLAGCDSAVTVFRVYDRPEWCGVVRGGHFAGYFTAAAKQAMARRDFLMPSGGVYAARREAYFRGRTFVGRRCGFVLIPPERNTDIDTAHDWHVAEMVLRRQARRRKVG